MSLWLLTFLTTGPSRGHTRANRNIHRKVSWEACEKCLRAEGAGYSFFADQYRTSVEILCVHALPACDLYTFVRDIIWHMIQANIDYKSVFQGSILELWDSPNSSSTLATVTSSGAATSSGTPPATTNNPITATSNSTASVLTAAPLELPQSMLDRITPQGQWPYTTWGMARRAGETATYTLRNRTLDDEGTLRHLAIILVPLQWNPRPLGKQSPPLQPSATPSGTNGTAPKLSKNGLGKRGTTTSSIAPITPREAHIDCGMTQQCKDFFLSLEMTFNASGGIRDPNNIDQSRGFQTMWCDNTNNTK